MSLSLLLIFIVPLFILPSILLPLNRLRMFLIGTISSFVVIAFIYMLNIWIGNNFLEQNIGKAFLFLSSFFYLSKVELSSVEIYHLSFSFFLIALYFLLYIIVFIPTKLLYIGKNPSFHKQINFFSKIVYSVLFFISTFSICFFFLINIREILPLNDGLFQNVFNFFYKIEA